MSDIQPWFIDLRPRGQFAAGHLPGSINVEATADLETYVGAVVPSGAPLGLVGPDEATIATARAALARIGIDPVAAHVMVEGGTVSYPVGKFTDLESALGSGRLLTVIDVRTEEEWRDFGHLPAARHIPWDDIAARLHEIPTDREVWVHCAAGFRAAIAASLLERAGRTPVLVDDRWWQVYDTGLAIEEAA